MVCRKFALSLLLLPCGIVVSVAAVICAAQQPASSDKPAPSDKIDRRDTKQAPGEKPAPITVAVTTDKKVYAVGSPVKLTLTARNTTKENVHLTFSNGQKFDFVIRRNEKSGSPVLWQWSRGRMFVEMLSDVTLPPGKTQTYLAVFAPQAGAGKSVALGSGTYTVSGILTVMQRSSRPSGATSFQIR